MLRCAFVYNRHNDNETTIHSTAAKHYSNLFSIYFTFHCILIAFALDGDVLLRNSGEKQYLSIKEKSSLGHGACWHQALQAIKNNCDQLDDYEHSILALKLANCFLEDSGHNQYNCHETESNDKIRRECINGMSDRAFSVYNEFYIHTTHICFYLNYEIWQTETKQTINQLYSVSSKMKKQLLEASQVQEVMLESQKKGLLMQNELFHQGKELGNVIQSSTDTVHNMVIDFKETAKDQKELLHEIFAYMRSFQNWIIGEVSWFQSIMYYVASCLLSVLFSSSKRTIDSRITLFVILSINIVIERMLVQYYETTLRYSPDSKMTLVDATWYLRKCAIITCGLILLYTYYFYKDEQVTNYKILQRIENQLNMIQRVNHDCDTNNTIRYSKRLALKRLNVDLCKQDKLNCTLQHENDISY